MKCKFCGSHNVTALPNGKYKCQWCGTILNYIPEPVEDEQFVEIRDFMEKVVAKEKERRMSLLLVPKP